MGAPRITPDQKRAFAAALAEGWTRDQAADMAGVSRSWAKDNASRFRTRPTTLRGQATTNPGQSSNPLAPDLTTDPHQPPVPADIPDDTPLARPLAIHELSPVARDCLDDFARFRARFFGRISSPWQEHAAQVVIEHLSTPEKEFGVINVAPGGGKSTLFTHDIPAWLTARSRSLRGFIGSGTQTTANSYTGRLRNTLERNIPQQAQSEEKALGLALDATSTLIHDYGIFKPPPDVGAPWSKSQFTVAQIGETRISEKEATWTAFGEDTRFLGWRVNFIVWDDLVTASSLKTEESIANQRIWWLNEAQTRLEPGGLLILQGQRLHADDLYRFCLDMTTGHDLLADWYEDLGIEQEPTRQKYFHVVYKAHHDEVCRADEDPSMHRMTAPPYNPADPSSGGCLLDPVRLSWRELMSVKAQPLTNFNVVYQQEDSSPTSVLVPEIFLKGGTDPETGEIYPGCYDLDRACGQPPNPIPVGRRMSAITVDPSPANFWAIQHWLYVEPPDAHHLTGNRFLIDQLRTPMRADDLLDYNVDSRTYTGVLERWWQRANELGIPYSHLIVEVNAAQKFLMQYSWFRRWASLRSVTLTPHTTTTNKSDQNLGVGILRPHYQYGRVRLPYHSDTREHVHPLIHELKNWPGVMTEDCVMANWFFEHKLHNLVPDQTEIQSLYNDIPEWANAVDQPGFLQALAQLPGANYAPFYPNN